MSICRYLILGLIAVVLVGCAAITEPFGLEDPFAIPRPFEGVERNQVMLTPSFELTSVVVEQPRGLSIEFANEIRDKVISALEAHDIPAQSQSTSNTWVLKARASTIVTNEKSGLTRGVLIWRLFNPSHNQVGQFSVTYRGGSSANVEPKLSVLAEQVLTYTLPLISQRAAVGIDVPTSAVVQTVSIGTIRGAPGDGNVALARALQGALPHKGIRVEDEGGKANWRIECAVKVISKASLEDQVVLVWRLVDTNGKEVGTLTQENPVPRGRLNKPWREIAGFAAEAAAEGIQQILQQVSAARPN